ncbi:MAG TPA: NADPH:quinone oxidoreductase family protein [Xanthobacteraceae bacterium]|jgi:NADPH2:quinone reductase|nr:NADPH:quinone oxidoreductase family protein [Xanthobacteraceae bacterium]
MRAVVIREFGPIESHALGDLPDPRPQAGEVVVDIKATAVNFVDILVVTGKYQFLPERPFAPGKLPAGIVHSIGAGVTRLKPGDRVLTLAEIGGYAQQVAVAADQCFKLPDGLSFVDAAAMSLVYDTSWFALKDRGRLKAGETVLVLGATGGVGLAAIQLAKAMGAKVLAGVSTPAKAQLVRDAGADAIIDLSVENLRDALRDQVHDATGGQGADVIIDPLGGDIFDAAIRALAWRGRLVVVGFAAGRIPTIKANYLLLKNIEVTGVQVSDYRKRTPELMAECIRDIFAMYAAGKLKPAPTVTYPLKEFATALADVRDRRVAGRIVLEQTASN